MALRIVAISLDMDKKMRTPLYEDHVKRGAKITEYAGWDMPLQYAGIAHEVEVVRNKVGLFDISHMGEFAVTGPNALALLQYVTTNDVFALQIGRAQYSLLCNENGGVIDDLIVYRLAEQEYLLIVNAANEKKDFEWISAHNSFGAELENQSAQTALIAVQGPDAERTMQNVAEVDVKTVGRFQIELTQVAGHWCRVARTGYTGEDGFEVLVAVDECADVWNALFISGDEFGAEPIGLGARDVLRLEAGLPLYGNELTDKTTPVEARLMWVVKPNKGDFIGKEAILRTKEAGVSRKLGGLEAVDRCIPRHGCDVLSGEEVVGVVSSGTFSPTLGKGIAMAYLDESSSEVGSEVQVKTGSRTWACRVVSTPFYKRK